jgi:AraC-like DNA-binding protein
MFQENPLLQPYFELNAKKYITDSRFLAKPCPMFVYELYNAGALHFVASPYTEMLVGADDIHIIKTIDKPVFFTPEGSHIFGVRFGDGFLPEFDEDLKENFLSAFEANTDFDEKLSCLINILKSDSFSFCPQSVDIVRRTIKNSNGSVGMDELSQITGYSNRHINRIFTAFFGYGPKEYSKLIRFHLALAEIFKNPNQNNSGFITNIGYSDQAHFQREFKYFMQETPRQFKKRLS